MDVFLVALAVASAFCFAFALVITQFGLRTIKPFYGASVALWTSALLFLMTSPNTFRWEDWHSQSAIIFAAVGLVFPVAVTLLTFHANQRIGPNLTGTLGNLTPMFAVTLAIFLLGEIPHKDHWIGIFAISAGVTLLFLNGKKRGRRITLLALSLPLAAAAIRGAAQPLIKLGLADWSNPFAAVTIGYIISAVVIGFLVSIRESDRPPPGSQGHSLVRSRRRS